MKTCESCHYGDMAFTAEAFSDKCGPYINKPADCPNWEPMTNADRVRSMDDATLSEVWNHMERSQEEWCEWLKKTE